MWPTRKDEAMKIEVIQHTTDNGKSTQDVLYSGDITPRRLAKAIKVAKENNADLKRCFGPAEMRVSPRFATLILLDGQRDDDLIERASGDRYDGKSWTQICREITS